MFKSNGVGDRLLFILLMGFATHAAAEHLQDGKPHLWKDMPPAPLYSYVATLSVGPVWENGGSSTETFYLQPGIQKTFNPNTQTNALANGEFFLGLQRSLTPRFDGQLGIAVAVTSPAKLSGNVWEDADPDFSNFMYDYNVNHTYVALKGKLLTDINTTKAWLGRVKPWISGSIGAGFNNATGFTLTQLIPDISPFPAFQNHSTTSLTYTLGAGVQRVINDHIQVGIGYEFADWGKNQLAIAPGQTLGSGLWSNHLYTNGLMFNLSYLS